MRSVGNQAVRLLAKEKGEHDALQLDSILAPFKSFQSSMMQGLDVSQESQALWQQAVKEHKDLISPLESRIGDKLRLFLVEILLPSLKAAVDRSQRKVMGGESDLLTHPHQIFHELKHYGELLSLQPVRLAVSSEIRKVIGHLETHLENIRSDYEEKRIEMENMRDQISKRSHYSTGTGNQNLLGKNVSVEVNNIAWTSQCERNVQQTLDLMDLLMGKGSKEQTLAQVDSNLASIKSAKALGMDMMKDIRDLKDFLMKNWLEVAQKKLKMAQSTQSSSLMDFDQSSGHIKLHFSDSLVTLVREARQISALGFYIINLIIKNMSIQ